MAKVYGVIFEDNDKTFYYGSDNVYQENDLVVISTSRGEQLVKVVQILGDKQVEIEGNIERIASDDDYAKYVDNLKNADKALKKCLELVKELELDMRVISANFNLDKSQLLFSFTAEARVDFRELAKKLAALYHTRIELRQVGARDKAKEVGGVGICGGELCCIRFLKNINAISMNMAKNQNLALNPSKINGSCGRLLCCLAYEDDVYVSEAKKMPSVGDTIKTEKGDAQVISVDVLNHRGKVLINGEKSNYEFVENSQK